jgi:hypothetical protein
LAADGENRCLTLSTLSTIAAKNMAYYDETDHNVQKGTTMIMLGRIIAFVIFGTIFFGIVPANAGCNDNGILAQDLTEWLNSSPDVVATTRQLFNGIGNSNDNYQIIVNNYDAYFGPRAAPIAEVGMCTQLDFLSLLNGLLQNYPPSQ